MNGTSSTGISYQFYIERPFVKQHEGMPNAVARVFWACVMRRGGAHVIGMGVTDLPEPNPEAFINIGVLEAAQVLQWVIDVNGGSGWVENYVNSHEEQMQRAEFDATLEPWSLPLVNPLKFDPNNV